MIGKNWGGVGNVCHAMSNEDGASVLPAETRARVRIDQQLTQAGWKVQDKRISICSRDRASLCGRS
ncbi:hypothetical protein NIIDMKKI_57230 [Mycobacterium kansasii]|uniref:Uncharacterized protein n=1 Tax=Mycobacterium kansasii TaxID=1768 RepID=A0A7G1II15_MYCKA|nr:hypothetical protein NIIDMKKI_57230 [Mycobacterium kansasii]